MARSRIASVALLVIVALIGLWAYNSREVPFDSVAWKNDVSRRPRMVRSLLAQDLRGATRTDIDALLGAPSGQDSARPDRYIYWAGTDGVIDDMWLELDFVADRVTAVTYGPD